MSKLKLNNNPGGRLLKMLKSKEKPKAARGLFGASHHLDTPSCNAKFTKDYEDTMHLDDEKVDYGATSQVGKVKRLMCPGGTSLLIQF